LAVCLLAECHSAIPSFYVIQLSVQLVCAIQLMRAIQLFAQSILALFHNSLVQTDTAVAR
jgi:hypothetical protein